MSKVYYCNIDGSPGNGVLEKLKMLCYEAGLDSFVAKDDLTAIKLHLGEMGNTRMLRPQFVSVPVNIIKEQNANPFLTDCNTLFLRGRFQTCSHLETARFNGFDHSVIGAPVVIADGLRGLDYRLVKNIDGSKEIKVGGAIYDADKLVVLTHFKGHEDTGFGGIIKNIGVGSIARPGKMQLHSSRQPQIDSTLCNNCGRCTYYCSFNAIEERENVFFINHDNCNSCGDCVVSCPRQAVTVYFDRDKNEMQDWIVQSCAAVLSAKKDAFYISFLVDITSVCDCRSFSPLPIIPDIGILAGRDPLAVEQASFDLVDKAVAAIHPGKSLFDFSGVDGSRQLIYAEQIGLGLRDYEIIEI